MEKKYHDWQTAFGINSTQEIEPSYFLQSLAEANIIGMITDKQAEELLLQYLNERKQPYLYGQDLVILRIKRFIALDTFSLTPSFLYGIHKYIFADVFPDNGVQRTRYISRKEPCLDEETVVYAAPDEISQNIKYDFDLELKNYQKQRSYGELAKNLALFASNIWQAHPFNDGNTRSTSVFIEMYLRHLGFKTDNNIFKNNSVYFRNALVRNNPTTCKSLHTTDEFLLKFFEKALIDPEIELDPKETYLSRQR